jgi:hypothetical protein
VGIYFDSSGAIVPLGERWNGTAWHAQPTPNPARASTNGLNGVSCPSSSDCTAVGLGNGDGTPFTLGERWQGGRWSLEAVPAPVGAAENQLNWVACPATKACMAVGTAGPTRGVFSTEALRWNGATWRLEPTPNRAGGSALFGVACTAPSACTAVGASNVFTPNGMTLAERWNGRSWAIQPAPNPSPGGFLAAVSCTSMVACTAVGNLNATANAGTTTLAERWNGTKWAIRPTPVLSAGQGSFFNSVACVASACTAVGLYLTNSGPLTLAERWNGARWHIQPTPLLPAVHDIGNFSVACPAQLTCMAVGGFENDGPGSKTLTEQWRGSGTSTALTAPAAFSARAFPGIAGCIRAAMGEGFATGAAATHIGAKFNAPMPQRSQPMSEIERITSLCGAA